MLLNKDFFHNKDTIKLAKDLLWKVIVVNTKDWIIKAVINETEAYIEDDEASHSFGWKKTLRNEVMFREYWHIYVYFTYGMYHCMNIVSEKEWYWSAILIRSVIPLEWLDLMIKNRKWQNKNLKELSNWPAKVCIALWIDKLHNWLNIFDKNSKIFLEDINYKIKKIYSWNRIWISKAQEKKWRFFYKN
jgi:DNA-3-methyladenine glycosylase